MELIPHSQQSNQDILNNVVRGGAWMYGRKLIISGLNLGVIAILARRLSPAEFGLVALANVILQLLVILGAEGVNQFVIYDNKEGREERVEAAFWMDLFFSSLSTLVGILLLPVITTVYSEEGLAAIMVVMLLRYPIDSVSKVPDALLKKRLDFQRLEVRDTVLQILSALTSVVMALAGAGVWSLVIPGLLISPVRAVLALRLSNWRPRFIFHVRQWPRIFSYSAHVIGGTLTSFIITEGDTLLIARLMGSQALGIYNIAWQSSNLVSRNITGLVNKLALPALAAVSEDLVRLQSGLSRMLRVLSIVAFPLLIGLLVIADDFILTVYGPQWVEAIVPLRIMIIFALRYAVGSPAGVVYKAMGRPDITLKLGLAIMPFYLLSIWMGSSYGIVGVAAGVTLVRTVFGLIGFKLVGWTLKIGFRQVVAPMIPALVASLWMGGVVLAANLLLDTVAPRNNLIHLVISVPLGGATYLLLLRTRYQSLARDLASVTAPIMGPFQAYVNKALKAS